MASNNNDFNYLVLGDLAPWRKLNKSIIISICSAIESRKNVRTFRTNVSLHNLGHGHLTKTKLSELLANLFRMVTHEMRNDHSLEVIKLLIDEVADVDHVGWGGETILQYAVRQFKMDEIKYLLQRGASLRGGMWSDDIAYLLP
ncbi:hypothetical protein BV898_18100 [Hypsibius exemplaris]|uniref:Uncharacterized protein n=1 Tax=Hypsibius exemplaris TaxID=2072580 RepID=A0A9X6NPU2_HYPEX|nr:hypothetical protein BV898_18100 [Hypsibius exemplaris]